MESILARRLALLHDVLHVFRAFGIELEQGLLFHGSVFGLLSRGEDFTISPSALDSLLEEVLLLEAQHVKLLDVLAYSDKVLVELSSP